jgi:hypothetical protein
MKRIWLVKTEWKSGGVTMTYQKTREDARNLKKSISELNVDCLISVKILKGYEYTSGRIYISGKVHY